jgi:hypothetical protein
VYRSRVSYDNNDISDVTAPKLTLVASLCGNGSCPTVYQTDRGTLVVQGYTVTPQNAGLDVPNGEQLVEIPADLLTALMQASA